MTDQMTQQSDQTQQIVTAAKKLGPLVAIGALMTFGFSQGWHHHLSLDALVRNREFLAAYVMDHYFLTLGLYVLAYVAAVALSFPGASILTIAGGLLFGWAVGGFTTVLAATIGASLIFLAARSAFGSSLRARAGGFIDRFSAGFREDAFSYLLFLRLVPLFPFWLVNVVPALFNIRLGSYILATMIGILPGTLAYAFIGAGLDSIIVAQREANPACATDPNCSVSFDPSALITGELIAAFVALGFVSLIPPVLKAIRKKRAS